MFSLLNTSNNIDLSQGKYNNVEKLKIINITNAR